jgi:hypothetical protein
MNSSITPRPDELPDCRTGAHREGQTRPDSVNCDRLRLADLDEARYRTRTIGVDTALPQAA